MATRSVHFLRSPLLLPLLALLLALLLSPRPALSSSPHHFEGFDAEDDSDADADAEADADEPLLLSPLTPPSTTLSSTPPPPSDASSAPKPSSLPEYDDDEFEGFPSPDPAHSHAPSTDPEEPPRAAEPLADPAQKASFPRSYSVEIACVGFLIAFAINYFTGKLENERIALTWAQKFATKDAIFDKKFSLLGTGDGSADTPLLLKEGNDVFKFYASGRRFCHGMLATMEMRSRHDLISRILDLVMQKRDTITFEVLMNDDAMDHVVFAMARKKLARAMHKEEPDLQRYAALVTVPPSGRKWAAEELMVVTESKEVAGDLLTDVVLDQVFGERSFEKFGKGFITMHFSDQLSGSRRKVLMFKFVLPDVNHMADMSRLVALVPYYIDLIGRYKLSSQAHSKTEAARAKAAQEVYRELQNVRQEVLQKKKAEKKKLMEEAEGPRATMAPKRTSTILLSMATLALLLSLAIAQGGGYQGGGGGNQGGGGGYQGGGGGYQGGGGGSQGGGGGYQGGGGGNQGGGGGYQGGGGGYQGGGGGNQGGGGGYQGGGGGNQGGGGGYQGGGGGNQGGGGGYQGGGGGNQGGGGGYQGGGNQGGGGGYRGGEGQQWQPLPFMPVEEPGKNTTVVKLGKFAVETYVNSTMMRSNLTFVQVLEAASRGSNGGTDYLIALQATDGALPRVYRADLFDSATGLDRLLYFKAVLS